MRDPLDHRSWCKDAFNLMYGEVGKSERERKKATHDYYLFEAGWLKGMEYVERLNVHRDGGRACDGV